MHSKQGFTLLEFSIVIVIIGLITGAVVTGRSMFEAAESRVLLSEIDNYTTSFKEFTDKYQAIPGDMNNAESIWGVDVTCPNTPSNEEPKIKTCNGDGNGTIGDWTNGAMATVGMEYEWFRAWQHLADAEMIDGRFSGVSGAGGNGRTAMGINVPASKSGKGGWTLLWMANYSDTDYFLATAPVASHVLIYGAQTNDSITDAPINTTTHMKMIDEKMDDALPFTGKIRVKRNTAGTCTVSSATTSDYLLSSQERACQLIYLLGA